MTKWYIRLTFEQADFAMNDIGPILADRFGEGLDVVANGSVPDVWRTIAARGSCRQFRREKVDSQILNSLLALAFCAPTKSDLQQRDVIVIEDPCLRRDFDTLLNQGPLAQPWISQAPHLLVFVGNNRRQRLAHEWRGRPFLNDHLDAFFNAAVDGSIALATFIIAAEAAGLGCCPISSIRNDCETVARLLSLPPHIFPIAGLGLGWPDQPIKRSMRLPLGITLHRNRYAEDAIRARIEDYDRRRATVQPFAEERAKETFGKVAVYGWSEDKVRQYSTLEREGFGAYVRKQGFRLE